MMLKQMFNRKSIATILMKHVEEMLRSRNVKIMLLEVSTENKGVQRIYQKLGYHAFEKFEKYDGYSDYSWMCKWVNEDEDRNRKEVCANAGRY